MKRFTKILLGIITILCLSSVPVSAQEYSVVPLNAVLYSHAKTVLYSDANLTSTIVLDAAHFPDHTPVVVTGITTNGFFQVNLGNTFYIPGNGLYISEETNNNENAIYGESTLDQTEVYNAIIGLKQQFPEGMKLTNESFKYTLSVPVNRCYRMGLGCVGFAYYVSDAVFGASPVVEHHDYNNLKVGDILRINNDTHSVVILEVKENSVIVVEGNYNSSVHWGRELTKSEIQDAYSYIWTRY